MGKEARTGKIPFVRISQKSANWTWGVLFSLGLGAWPHSLVWAAPKGSALSVGLTVSQSSEPKSFVGPEAPNLDPREFNPGQAFWLLERDLKWVENEIAKEVIPKQAAAIPAVSLKRIEVHLSLQARVRADGDWYSTQEQVGCFPRQPVRLLSTKKSVTRVSFWAAKEYEALVRENILSLEFLFSKLKARDTKILHELAGVVWRQWVSKVEQAWKAKLAQEARRQEWRYLLEDEKPCSEGENPTFVTEKIEKLLLSNSETEVSANPEPSPSYSPYYQKFRLARAPSRRWNGQFTVRLTLKTGSGQLNGNFLIDTLSPVSSISQEFMSRQGWPKAALQDRNQTVSWMGYAHSRSSLKEALVDRVEFGGFGIENVALAVVPELSVVTEPESIVNCCDGVVGTDLLRHYGVRFESGSSPAVELWSEFPKGALPNIEWLPARFVSLPTSKGVFTESPTRPEVWMTEFFENPSAKGSSIPVAWSSLVSSPAVPKFKSAGLDSLTLEEGERVFDFPHGRQGISAGHLGDFSKSLKVGVASRSRSNPLAGVTAFFKFEKGDRVLRVRSIDAKTSIGRAFLKSGIKNGHEILALGGKAAGELDQWQVNQLLAGSRSVKAKELTLKVKWRTPPKQIQELELKLKPE